MQLSQILLQLLPQGCCHANTTDNKEGIKATKCIQLFTFAIWATTSHDPYYLDYSTIIFLVSIVLHSTHDITTQ